MSDETEIETKLVALDIKDKLLVITSNEAMTAASLARIRNKVVELGGLGMMYLPNAIVKADSLDACIRQLQTMKEELEEDKAEEPPSV
jgi:hypothetical protein